jgi:hypothetical protein
VASLPRRRVLIALIRDEIQLSSGMQEVKMAQAI